MSISTSSYTQTELVHLNSENAVAKKNRLRYLAREIGWSLMAIVLLAARVITSITTLILGLGWILVAVRSDLLNSWLLPVIISFAVLVLSNLGYALIRADSR